MRTLSILLGLAALHMAALEHYVNAAPIEHQEQVIEGWHVQVDAGLLTAERKELWAQGLRILSSRLYEISLLVPTDRLADMRETPIFVDLDHPLRSMQYHPSAGWLRDNGYDVAMAKAVHIPKVEYLIKHQIEYRQPWAMLHELAHAYHDRVLGFDYEPIRKQYEAAVDSKLYESVLFIEGKKVKHYALTNHKEYFAELTESYFTMNDFYPFVRGELAEYDPDSFALMETIWRKKREK